MVNHTFYPHVNQGLKFESVQTPLSRTCLDRPEYNYQKVRTHTIMQRCPENGTKFLISFI